VTGAPPVGGLKGLSRLLAGFVGLLCSEENGREREGREGREAKHTLLTQSNSQIV